LIRIVFDELFVQLDGTYEIADSHQCGGIQIAEVWIVGRTFQQEFRLRKHFRGAVQVMKNDSIAVSRSEKPWSYLKTACKNLFRIFVPAEPHCHLGIHAQGMRVGWVFLQKSPQQRFGNADFVLLERRRSIGQSRIASRRLDLVQISVVGCIDREISGRL